MISSHWCWTSSVGGPFAPPDAAEFIVNLAARRRRADDDHDAKSVEIIAKTAPITP